MVIQQTPQNRIVFISYTTRDDGEAFSKELEKNIEENTPYIAFRAQSDLKDGDRWSKKIDKYIEDCFVLIVVVTTEANESRWVTYEWAYAAGRGKPIVALIRSKEADKNLHDKIPKEFHINIGRQFIKPVPSEHDWKDLYNLLNQIYNEIHIPPYVANALEAARSYDRKIREAAINYLRDTKLRASENALIELCENSFHDEVLIRASIALAERNQNNHDPISPIVIRGLIRGVRGSTWLNEAKNFLQMMDNEHSIDAVYKAYLEEQLHHHKSTFWEILLNSNNREVILPILHRLKVVDQHGSANKYDLNVINVMLRFDDPEAIDLIKQIVNYDEIGMHVGSIQNIITNLPRYSETVHPLLIDLLRLVGKRAKSDYSNWAAIYNMVLTSIEHTGTEVIQDKLEALCTEADFYDLHGNATTLVMRMKQNR